VLEKSGRFLLSVHEKLDQDRDQKGVDDPDLPLQRAEIAAHSGELGLQLGDSGFQAGEVGFQLGEVGFQLGELGFQLAGRDPEVGLGRHLVTERRVQRLGRRFGRIARKKPPLSRNARASFKVSIAAMTPEYRELPASGKAAGVPGL
jgi:hypothetical protein